MVKVGTITTEYADFLHFGEGADILQSEGLLKHVAKRHPECVHYLSKLSEIISSPDYIGVNPNERGKTFEIVKILDENILIGIKFDITGKYFFVATIHTITTAKLTRHIESSRLVKFSQETDI